MDIKKINLNEKSLWIDVINPSPDDLVKLAYQYDIQATSIQDCLDAKHLPKFELFPAIQFFILRAFDKYSSDDATSVQEMTRKVAIFASDTLLLTIHRKKLDYIESVFTDVGTTIEKNSKIEIFNVLGKIVRQILVTYDDGLDIFETSFERFEESIFSQNAHHFNIKKGYALKRKVAIIKKMLRLTVEPIEFMFENAPENFKSKYQSLVENTNKHIFQFDDLYDSINGAMALQISLASHETNEVMRILTVFSIFFLPLNFLAGIYGMNFDLMPELKWRYGYPLVIGLMVAVVISIFLWLRKNGWLKS